MIALKVNKSYSQLSSRALFPAINRCIPNLPDLGVCVLSFKFKPDLAVTE